MKAILIGIFSAFAYSFGLGVIASTYGMNHDTIEAVLVKSTIYALLIAFPIGVAGHVVVAFFHWRLLFMIPVVIGIASTVAALLCVSDPCGVQLINISGFIVLPLVFSIPYALVLNR